MYNIITDREIIKDNAEIKEEENGNFRIFLKGMDSDELDKIVHPIAENITNQIDCTTCAACCKSLMINVTEEETILVAEHLKVSENLFKEKYVEKSSEGEMIINAIPCHFLEDTKCGIYENRFSDCREFPHLHKNNFNRRLFSTIMNYEICPIIYNTIEALKIETGFKA